MTLEILSAILICFTLAINLFFALPILIKSEIDFKKRRKRCKELRKEYDRILAQYENDKENNGNNNGERNEKKLSQNRNNIQ